MTPDHFPARRAGASGSELTNAQRFARESCELRGPLVVLGRARRLGGAA